MPSDFPPPIAQPTGEVGTGHANWQTPPHHLPPFSAPDRPPVDVWCLDIRSLERRNDAPTPPTTPDWNLLSADERSRAQRYRFDGDRRRFVTVRSSLRRLLGRYLDAPAADLDFTYSDRGKPALRDVALSFNVSHSQDVALIAIAGDRAVGVDLEYHRSSNIPALARRFFHPQEAAELQARPASDRDRRFFQYWTAKEAYLKATGDGLAKLSDIEICWQGATPHLSEKPGWHLHPLHLHPQYSAALVVESGKNEGSPAERSPCNCFLISVV